MFTRKPKKLKIALLLYAAVLAISTSQYVLAESDSTTLAASSRWTKNKILVCWENGSEATLTEQNWVRNRIRATWGAASAVSFIGWESCDTSTSAGIRILIEDAAPHVVALGKNLRNKSNGMVLNFSFANWGASCRSNALSRSCIESIAIHEFGHALGIAHAQSLPITDRSLCDDAPLGRKADIVIHPLDYRSIMSHCSGSDDSNDISARDRAIINSMYPRNLVDFNGDGRTDVALLAVPDFKTVPVAFASGSGAFNVTNLDASADANAFDLAIFNGYAGAEGVKIIHGDFNHDGFTDLVVAGGSSGTLPVAFSKGNGDFSLTDFPISELDPIIDFGWVARKPGVQFVAGDFNGDGRLDIALTGGVAPLMANAGPMTSQKVTTIPVAFSTGTGYFYVTGHTVANFPAWAARSDAKAIGGDFNGDGRTDIALVGIDGRNEDGGGVDGANVDGWNGVPIAFSNGNGSFDITTMTNASILKFVAWAHSPGAQVLSGDFNADGRTDLAIVGRLGAVTLPVAFSNGDGSFRVANAYVGHDFQVMASTVGAKIRAADFNGDMRTDIVIAGLADLMVLPMAFSKGNGRWRLTNNPVVDFPAWSAMADTTLLLGDFDRNRAYDLGLTGSMEWESLPMALSTSLGNFKVTQASLNQFDTISQFAQWASQSGVKVITE